MDATTFEVKLDTDGYTEHEIKSYDRCSPNGEHGHHFSVSGLVLNGVFIVIRDQKPVAYGAGEVFEVAEGCLYSDEIGSTGARVLIGRKY